MDCSQPRNNARGHLIAVIKIQIDPNRTDRIFLHQHDNDRVLAQMFVAKHRLNPVLVPHIYDRIRFSRQSVEQTEQQNPITPYRDGQISNRGHNYSNQHQKYEHNDYKLQTPVNHLGSQHLYTEEQSFGNTQRVTGRKDHKEYAIKEQRIEYENQEDYLFSEQRASMPVNKERKGITKAPNKMEILRNKEFMFYDQENQENQQCEVNLFGTNPNIKNILGNSKKRTSTAKKEQSQVREQSGRKSTERRNALDIIKQQEKQSEVVRSKSMMKLGKQEPVQVQQIFRNASRSVLKTNNSNDYDRPSRVKIIKKDQMQSLNQSLKKSMSKQEISRINKDVTKRLYNQNDIKKNYLQIIKQKAKKNKQKQIDTELTLKPQINKVSRVIAQGRRRPDMPIEDYLIALGQKAQNKKAEINSKKLCKEIQHCSFKPEVNFISKMLVADKQNFQSRLKEQSMKRSCYKDTNTFRPSLNKVTEELMKDKGNFQERQKLYIESRNEKLMDLVHERLIGQQIDLRTGQELYKPIINDTQVRESQGENIGNYLYMLSKEQSEVLQTKQLKPRISQASEAMVQQMYLKRITWLFSQLDSDQDGIISPQKICIDTISPEILDIIKPILFEMQQINEELTLMEFKQAIDILHKKLNVNEKGVLYNYRQKTR